MPLYSYSLCLKKCARAQTSQSKQELPDVNKKSLLKEPKVFLKNAKYNSDKIFCNFLSFDDTEKFLSNLEMAEQLDINVIMQFDEI